ncbi:MAG: helix-turn-helix domain-containing protein [Prevotellaceae bacterium]|jgi:predicted transcriptional regulator|nr:helix-turn-helix domain-containing protein [Prevotellaceae bacterium]
MSKKEKHIGEFIEQKVSELGMSKTEFARLINCSRSNIYYIFQCKSINFDKLQKISDVLNFDFSAKNIPHKNKKYLVLYEISDKELSKYQSDSRTKYIYPV